MAEQVSTASAPASGPHSKGSGFRPDLEGLRALAVGLVLLDHVVGWPRGGFIGVDVFFVLSGFLITGLLLKEFERTGKISFRTFYARRIKRILPMSTLVVGVTAAVSYAVFLGPRLEQILVDAFYSTLFSANWRFVLVGQDYFAADRAVSPLQHYWSLAVEEQFYFIWPLLMLGVLTAIQRSIPQHGRRALLMVLGIVTTSSFIWALLETTSNPTTAYFSTFSRAWELGVGGLLAVAASAFRTRRAWVHQSITYAGLALVVISGLLLTPAWNFPGPWAALPVLGTLLVIAGGIRAPHSGLTPLLTNFATRYIGRISFSLYLWHWPVVVFLQPFMAEGSWTFVGVGLCLSLGLSVMSYHFVEDVIRRSQWLTGKKHGGSVASARRRRRRVHVAVLATLLPLTGGAAYASVKHAWPPVTPANVVTTATGQTSDVDAVTEGSRGLEQEIRIALERADWPAFAVPLEELEDSKAPEWTDDGCIDVTDSDLERCTYEGPGSRTAIVIGDSVAISWMAGLREVLGDADYEVVLITMGQCPAVSVSVTNLGGEPDFAERCLAFQDWTMNKIDEYSPELVVMSSAENSLSRLSSGTTGSAARGEWETATKRTLDGITAPGRDVVVLAPPPEGINLQGCVTRFNGPSSCTSTVDASWIAQSEAEAAAVDSSDGARYVSTRDWFCRSDGVCPAFVEDIPVRADGNHLTSVFSAYLAPELRTVLDVR